MNDIATLAESTMSRMPEYQVPLKDEEKGLPEYGPLLYPDRSTYKGQFKDG